MTDLIPDNGLMLQPHQPDHSANGHCVLQSKLPSFPQNERAILVRISRFQLLSIAALNNSYTHLITIAQAHRQRLEILLPVLTNKTGYWQYFRQMFRQIHISR